MIEQAELFTNAVSHVLPVVVLQWVRVLLRRSNFLRSETIEDIKKLIVNLTLPALLFLALVAFAMVKIVCRPASHYPSPEAGGQTMRIGRLPT